MAEAHTATRRRRGTVQASITKLEMRIQRWEEEDGLSSFDHLSVQCHVENLKEHDADFRRHHFTVVELVNEDDLVAKQAILDEDADKVTDYMDCLQQLLPIPENAFHKASARYIAEGLLKRLRCIVRELTTLNDSADSVASGPKVRLC